LPLLAKLYSSALDGVLDIAN